MDIKARILVVDDNRDLCENIKEILKDNNYLSECAFNGNEVIKLAGNSKYDVAIIDIRLPDISGSEVVEKIAVTSPSTDFIYMTGHATINSTIEAVKQKNVVSYETKPLDLNHLLATIYQVVERKKAERELHQFGHIVSCSTDMIAFMDKNFLYVAANPAYLDAFNKSHKELIGHSGSEVFGEEFFGTAIKPHAELCLAGKEVNYQVWMDFPKYGKRYMDVTYYPYTDENSKITGFVVNGRNITDRKQMEETLLQSEKLKSIGTITAGISHEFNNILAVISGKVQLLEMYNKDNTELTDELRTIMRATDDGAAISNKMLQFTKTDQDANEFVSSDIVDMIVESIDFTKPRWRNEAQAKGIDYRIDKEGMNIVPRIMCNPTELREVLINIINNAIDAMPDGGTLSFRTRSVDDTALVSISDTGMGMPVDVKNNIFDPFFTTKTPVGTGLGMSMAYGIVTRHGGSIVVESEPGKGSTFNLQFPTATKTLSTATTPELKQETKKVNLRILAVDDEEVMRNILFQFLSRDGHNIKTVDNGADAIKMSKSEDFDLVLCDIAMPDIFGYDVIKVLNGLKKRPKIGIISGWNKKLSSVTGKEFKVDFYLKKPFKHSELTRHINDLRI